MIVSNSVGRLFRSYFAYCTTPNQDSLFILLNAFHSAGDQLKNDHGIDIYESNRILILRAIRNEIHHGSDIKFQIITNPFAHPPGIFYMCIIDSDALSRAINSSRYKQDTITREVPHQCGIYGKYTDINPCVFNGVVDFFEKVRIFDKALEEDESLREFYTSYLEEEQLGIDHHVAIETNMSEPIIHSLISLRS